MPNWNWPGARWWRCDLHVHTNGSDEVTQVAPADVVRAATALSLDVLGITDHNTGAAIADVMDAAAQTTNAPVVLPGVELTVAGVHLVVLFDANQTGDDVIAFLGACGITGSELGKDDAHATCTVLEAMRLASTHGAIVIAAHVDDAKGLLTVIQSGQDLMDVVRSEHLWGAEVKVDDADLLSFIDNSKEGYKRRFGPLTLIESSDAHQVADVGSRTTWIKMTSPCAEGLRLALQDGALSVWRCSEVTSDPNTHAELVVESIAVTDTKLMGRGGTFALQLNPWFNAIIGGRGTGKSTLIEMARIALDREDEIPEAIRDEFQSLARVPVTRDESGLLLDETVIEVIYRKGFDRYKIRWNGETRTITREIEVGEWEASEGDVAQRFPVKVFSQKQVFEIARDPSALLKMVDDAIEEEDFEFTLPLHSARRVCSEARLEVRSCAEQIETEGKLKGELEDANRRIAVYEGAAHAAVRKEYKARVQQEAAIEAFAAELQDVSDAIQDLASSLEPPEIAENVFSVDDPVDLQVLKQVEEALEKLSSLRGTLTDSAAKSATLRKDFEVSVKSITAHAERLKNAKKAYDDLKKLLEDQAEGTLDDYDDLVARRGELIDALREIDALRPQLARAEADLKQAASDVLGARKQMTHKRVEFVTRVIGTSQHIRVEVIPYGSRAGAEARLRAILARPDGGFDRDISAILDELYEGYRAGVPDANAVEQFEVRLNEIQTRLVDIACGNELGHQVKDARFATHLASLTTAATGEIEMWFPYDSLRVSYSPAGDGEDFKPLEHGSPGQKTAALLAFILSHGDSPIILDQPEDDLENRLIYELVVRRIREVKSSRQVIIVTHDANIVVNGDAEFVAVFDFLGGRTTLSCSGGLQEEAVREAICEVLEGGRLAFEERYRRIGDGEE